jgi:outer membrane protein assembly factor BamB
MHTRRARGSEFARLAAAAYVAFGAAVALAAGTPSAAGGDATSGMGYRGIHNSGLFPGKNLLKEWPEDGPELLWKYDVGIGYCGAAVSGDRVYVAGGEVSYLYTFSLDGRLEGRVRIGPAGWARFTGTRSVPLIRDGLAVTTTPDANIYAVDLARQEIRWRVNAWKDFGVGKGTMGWGYPESPIPHQGKILLNACSRTNSTPPIVALDFQTGKPVWQADAGEGKKYSAADVSGAVVRHGSRHLALYPT